MIQGEWDREAASYPQRCTSESWLEDPSASSEAQNDPQKLFELKYKTSENDSCYIRCKNSNSDRLQDARRRPPAASGPNRIFLIEDQV